MRAAILFLCLLVSHAQAAPSKTVRVRQQIDADAKTLVALMQKNLPSGWAAKYEAGWTDQTRWATIKIRRLKPIAMYSRPVISAPAPDPNEKPEKPAPLSHYELILRIDNFLTTTIYKNIKAKNAAIMTEMKKVSSGLEMGKGSYYARNAAEAQRVQRYEKLEKSLYELPDYYWRHLSFSNLSIDLWGKSDYELVIDSKVRAKCKQVTLIVLGLLKPYQ